MAEKIDSHDPRVDERTHLIIDNEYSAKSLPIGQYFEIVRRATQELNEEAAHAAA